MGVVQKEALEEQLVEASEILQIIESYFSKDLSHSDPFALRGLKVLLKESRIRVERVATQLAQESRVVRPNVSVENQSAKSPVVSRTAAGEMSAGSQVHSGAGSSGNGARTTGAPSTAGGASLGSGIPGQDTRRAEGRTLASRIKRLPEGEFRTVELDLESETDELVAEDY